MNERPASVSRISVRRPVLVVAFALAVVSAPGSVTQARPSASEEGGPEATASAERPARDGVRFSAGSVRLSRVWWNQARHVEALRLTDEQRSAMDALLVDHLERRRELAREFMQLRRDLGDHMAEAAWESAEKTAEELDRAWGAMARAEAGLAMAAVRLLEPDQRKALDEQFPMLLRRPWVYGGTAQRGFGRGVGPAPARRPGAPPGR